MAKTIKSLPDDEVGLYVLGKNLLGYKFDQDGLDGYVKFIKAEAYVKIVFSIIGLVVR